MFRQIWGHSLGPRGTCIFNFKVTLFIYLFMRNTCIQHGVPMKARAQPTGATVLFFNLLSLWDRTQVIRLGGKCLHTVSQLTTLKSVLSMGSFLAFAGTRGRKSMAFVEFGWDRTVSCKCFRFGLLPRLPSLIRKTRFFFVGEGCVIYTCFVCAHRSLGLLVSLAPKL